ncbi:MAG: potassium transporter Kup [Sphingomonadales bacterium]|nr:potassium transporter Kup [Sphingomonadales bacterium]
MTSSATAVACAAPQDYDSEEAAPHIGGSLSALMLGATGVVFGDIGTSPLYALQAILTGEHPLAINITNIYGVISLIFWTMLLVVTFKYVGIVMRCDNHGEGGSLALLALINRKLNLAPNMGWITICGLLATALFYADSMLTPAISVVSAVEGLGVVSHDFRPFIVPIALVILIGLFVIQSHGTDRVGRVFGPIMVIYFVVIAALGVMNISSAPRVLYEPLNPWYIVVFFKVHPLLSFLSLSAVVYAITGVEALYADMGHFGRKPIAFAWIFVVLPALILNYMGQAALLITRPQYSDNPFFHMAPPQLLLPLVILATMATVIASQAVISGAFSVTQQAMQLGYIPRFHIKHTSSEAAGQIYVGGINWFLAVMVAGLVVVFRSSAAMLPAYGLAVVGTMLITTLMISVMFFRIWKTPLWIAAIGTLFFVAIDGAYLAAGTAKFFEGAWFPVVVALIIFTLLTTWADGRRLLREKLEGSALPVEVFIKSVAKSAQRIPGTAVFLTAAAEGVPAALLHNIKHNHVIHEHTVLLNVKIVGVPVVPDTDRYKVTDLGEGFWRVRLRYGFMQQTDVPAALRHVEGCGTSFDPMKTSFFMSRETLLPSRHPGMAIWREHIFTWMMRMADSAMGFFNLPTNRVVELGSQIEI